MEVGGGWPGDEKGRVTGEHTGLELNRPDLSPVSTD